MRQKPIIIVGLLKAFDCPQVNEQSQKSSSAEGKLAQLEDTLRKKQSELESYVDDLIMRRKALTPS